MFPKKDVPPTAPLVHSKKWWHSVGVHVRRRRVSKAGVKKTRVWTVDFYFEKSRLQILLRRVADSLKKRADFKLLLHEKKCESL